MNRKVLIIGIDGGTWTILRPAMEQGYMPYLKSLCQAGSYGILESTIPAITAPAWASFQTGMNPGKTGVFNFYYWDIDQKKKHLVSSQTLQGTIWEIASQHGRRVGVINVPMTYPPKPVNGYMVTGILTPSPDSEFTYPAQLKQQLLNAVPDYHIFNSERITALGDKQFESFLEQMVRSTGIRTEAAQFIIDKEALDVFMVHFQATDILQHKFWPYMESGHPSFDPHKREYIFNKFYSDLDRRVKQVKETFEKKAGADYVTFIVSDHGFQLNKKRFNLAKWLHQKGWLYFERKFFWLPFFKELLGKIDVLRLRRHLVRKLKSRTGRMLSLEGPISWQNSRAISMGSNNEGFIYLVGEDMTRRRQTVSELISELGKIKDPEDGTPIVKQIYHKEQVFSGDFLEFMPDLIIEPADTYSFVGYYKVGAALFHDVNPEDDFQVGRHHRDGILIAVGNQIKHLENTKAHITDIAPTILYYLGLPIDENVDGRVLKEIFTEQFLNQQPVHKSSQAKTKPDHSKTQQLYSDNDQQQIEKRLRDLGYL